MREWHYIISSPCLKIGRLLCPLIPPGSVKVIGPERERLGSSGGDSDKNGDHSMLSMSEDDVLDNVIS